MKIRNILTTICNAGASLDAPLKVNGQTATGVEVVHLNTTGTQLVNVTTQPVLHEPADVTIIYNCPICLHEASQFADTLVESGTALCPECDCDMEILRIRTNDNPAEYPESATVTKG